MTDSPRILPGLAGLPDLRAAARSPVLLTLLGSAALFAASRLLSGDWSRLALALMAELLLAAALLQQGWVLLRRGRRRTIRRVAALLAADDASPCYLADAAGRILSRNRAARAEGGDPATVADALAPLVGEAGTLVADLSEEARRTGVVADHAIGRRGAARLTVRPLDSDSFLWRLDRRGDATPAEAGVPRLTLDARGRSLAANAAFRRLVGVPPRHLDQLVQDPPLVPGRVHRVATESGPLDRLLVLVPSAGEDRDLLLLPPQGAAATLEGWAVLEGLPVALLRLSPTGVLLAANRHARTLLPAAGPGETRLSDLLEGLGRPVGEWVADVAAGRPTTGPQFLRGRGEHRDVVLRVALNPAGPPEDPHLLAVLDDVTELKSLEEQFVQSQKMQALGQLAGGVAHDFNNLLTAISGHSDLLLLRHDAGDPDYGDLVQIRQNVNRAASLVGQLLAFSRKQSMIAETLDLRMVLSDLTHLLNRLVGERVHLSLDHEPTLGFVRADKRQLEQVIMNLVVNARDAMPEGGEIRISTANHRLDRPRTFGRATVPAGRYVLVHVADEGTGIPAERLPKIFDPFYTTKKPGEGTGLGLSTVYGIVKQSGGYVFADSEVGKGSTFTLWFPAHDRPAAAVAAPAPPAPRPAAAPRSPRGTVLLVEDEAGVRAFAARALRMRGHTVLEADSGEAALALLADPALRPDLILTDVILPDADGPTWVREALESRPGTRVVFMSGYAEDAFSEQKALIEGSAFLPKPFSLTDLAAIVEERMAADGDAAPGRPPAP